MGYAVNWTDLPEDLVINVAHRLCFLEEFVQFSAVCKSWKSATESYKPLWLPRMRCPMLLLAEAVAPGAIPFNCEYSDTDEDEDEDEDEGEDEDEDEDGDEEEDDEDEDEDGDEEEDDEEEEEDAVADDGSEKDHATQFFEQRAQYVHSRNSIGSTRGLYSLLLMKTYNIELPEAAGRLILGTNKGWLVTLGRDLQINLLHPLLRYQFSLPPMLTFPRQYDEYHEYHTPEEASEQFIQKVAMSSKLLNKNTDVSSFQHHATPIVMSVYGSSGFLGFARLGDKSWTDVNVPSRSFKDIVYHKGNFYAVDSHGDVYLCCIDDCKGRGGPRGTKIASLDTDDWDPKYLVESLSGSDLFLIVRNIQFKHFREPLGIEAKYRTTYFSVWRLHLKYDSLEIPSCTLTKENNLGDEAIFVGRASSFSVSSSEIIKPNSIYFTDDNWELFIRSGGGHDMGIFDMERRTIEPHFPGKSIHPISPPLWCI